MFSDDGRVCTPRRGKQTGEQRSRLPEKEMTSFLQSALSANVLLRQAHNVDSRLAKRLVVHCQMDVRSERPSLNLARSRRDDL